MDRFYSRGEIISQLQHLPYHSFRARALRVFLTLIENQNDGKNLGSNSDRGGSDLG